jgi:hypothetical protein
VIKEALVTTVPAESIVTSRPLLADFDAMTLNDEVRCTSTMHYAPLVYN